VRLSLRKGKQCLYESGWGAGSPEERWGGGAGDTCGIVHEYYVERDGGGRSVSKPTDELPNRPKYIQGLKSEKFDSKNECSKTI
jgi:hypothetical protein